VAARVYKEYLEDQKQRRLQRKARKYLPVLKVLHHGSSRTQHWSSNYVVAASGDPEAKQEVQEEREYIRRRRSELNQRQFQFDCEARL